MSKKHEPAEEQAPEKPNGPSFRDGRREAFGQVYDALTMWWGDPTQLVTKLREHAGVESGRLERLPDGSTRPAASA